MQKVLNGLSNQRAAITHAQQWRHRNENNHNNINCTFLWLFFDFLREENFSGS